MKKVKNQNVVLATTDPSTPRDKKRVNFCFVLKRKGLFKESLESAGLQKVQHTTI